MSSLPASPTTSSSSSGPESDAPPFLVGSKITPGYGGINQALTEGKGWSDEDVLAYAKTIGDNHPMFAETVEVCSVNAPANALAVPHTSFPSHFTSAFLSSIPAPICLPFSTQEMDPAMVEAMQAIKFDGKDFKQLAIQAKSKEEEEEGKREGE